MVIIGVTMALSRGHKTNFADAPIYVMIKYASDGGVPMKRVLIVEDNKEAAESLRLLLTKEGYECCWAETKIKAYEAIKTYSPHICILDITLPDGNGIRLCENIRQKYQNMAILFVTADDSEESLVQGFKAGGDDYLVKPFRSRELLARIAAAARKYGTFEEAVSTWHISGDLRMNFDERKVYKNGETLTLRPKEYALLEQLVKANGGLLKRIKIFAEIWDNEENYVEENNLSVLASRLRNKLGDYQGKPYFETVWGIGYRWSLPVIHEKGE